MNDSECSDYGKGKIITLSRGLGKEFEYTYISIKFEISREIAVAVNV